MEDDLHALDSSASDIEVDENITLVREQVVLNMEVEEESCRRDKRMRNDSEALIDDGFTKVTRKAKRSKIKSSDGEEQQENSVEERKFIVSITSKEILPKQFGMAKLLRAENIQNILRIIYKNPYRVLIEFDNKSDSDKLINCEKMNSLEYRCNSVDQVNLCYGIVRQVDLDIEEKEALDNLRCEQEIVSIKRLKRLGEEGKWVDSESIRLCIRGSTLPPYVFGYGCRFKVDPYTFPVSQCTACWRFGHLSRSCPAKRVVCPKCAGEHKHCETTTFSCVNCKGAHMALYKQCPVFLKEKEIRSIMCKQNCTFKKAVGILLENKEKRTMEIGSETSRQMMDSSRRISQRQTYTDESQKYPLYSDILVNNANVSREEKEYEEDTEGIEIPAGTQPRARKRAKTKKTIRNNKEIMYEIHDSQEEEEEMDISQKNEEESSHLRSTRNLNIFRKLLKIMENIILSEKSFEEKLKCACSVVFKECVQLLLGFIKRENLIATLVSCISNNG